MTPGHKWWKTPEQLEDSGTLMEDSEHWWRTPGPRGEDSGAQVEDSRTQLEDSGTRLEDSVRNIGGGLRDPGGATTGWYYYVNAA